MTLVACVALPGPASALSPPQITHPTDGTVFTDPTVVVAGTADPGARVEVAVNTGGTMTADAGANGSWSVAGTFGSAVHTLEPVAVDQAGNRVSGPPVTFRVDLLDPGAPRLWTPGDGALVAALSVRLSGSAEPGSTLRLSDEGAEFATLTPAEDGTWSITRAFAEGWHSVVGQVTDDAGRSGPVSEPMRFRVDATAPGAPVIDSPEQDGLIDAEATFTGAAEPGARVDLLKGTTGITASSTIADGEGSWTIRLNLSHGAQSFTARARDAAGNVGPVSAVRRFRADADYPSVAITTDQQIFTPTQALRIEGTAEDAIGVFGVEVRVYDLLGKLAAARKAYCNDCLSSPSVAWAATVYVPRGRYEVVALAADLVGHRGASPEITVLRL